jgi:hypothetical protein
MVGRSVQALRVLRGGYCVQVTVDSGKHASLLPDARATIEMLETAFCMRSVPRVYTDDGGKPRHWATCSLADKCGHLTLQVGEVCNLGQGKYGLNPLWETASVV